MSDIFKLFEGGGAGTGGVQGQDSQSFSDVKPENDLIGRIASGFDTIELRVDYSDFDNFVTFNSAEAYVTTTADQILNEYPLDGTIDDLQAFLDSLDGYQRYFLRRWPSWTGHLRFDPSVSPAYIHVNDFGVENGVSRTSFMSPGTGSFSIQAWIDVPSITGSEDVAVIFDKRRSDGDGYGVYVSGSSVCFSVTTGSVTSTAVAPITQKPVFFAAVCDQTAGSLDIYLGSTGSFPTLAGSTAWTPGRLDLGSGSFLIGSGSIPNKRSVWFTGSIDDVTVWSYARTVNQLSSSYNRKVYSQPGLLAAWRFNEATPSTPSELGNIVRDCSGHRLDGRIRGYSPLLRGSGSISHDSPDPVLILDPDVIGYVVDAQRSGSRYDETNETLIWKLFPAAFSQTDPLSAEVFKNFSLIIARSFDSVKLYIDQLLNLRRVRYGEHDQVPDTLLDEVGEFFGWQLQGSFIDVDALRYLLGRDILLGPDSNVPIETRLADIKSQFWRRTLLNLSYIYKSKGTRESVEALLRSYGLNGGLIKLKEYAHRAEAAVPTERVNAEKSVWALTFGSGSYSTRVDGTFSPVGTSGPLTVEVRVRFPGPSNDDLPPVKTSGSILTLMTGSEALSLWYQKSAATDLTGGLFLTSSAGMVSLGTLPIFDDRFYNVSVVRETRTGSLSLDVRLAEDGLLLFHSGTRVVQGYPGDGYESVSVGAWAGASSGEFWAQEVRIWGSDLTEDELIGHTLDFNSYGRERSKDNDQLIVHWRLDDGVVADGLGGLSVLGSTPVIVDGTGTGFLTGVNPFKKYLLGYSYIPSLDYGWNQRKVRVFSGPRVDPYEAYEDENILSLEFNMYDALNRDISHMLSSYDELNAILGLPVNKYRSEYEGLQQMRETYFKRLQGQLNLTAFIDMLDFFDVSFIKMVERLLPARVAFKGDEVVVESHMLERPKYQYGLRPIREGTLDVSGSITMIGRE